MRACGCACAVVSPFPLAPFSVPRGSSLPPDSPHFPFKFTSNFVYVIFIRVSSAHAPLISYSLPHSKNVPSPTSMHPFPCYLAHFSMGARACLLKRALVLTHACARVQTKYY